MEHISQDRLRELAGLTSLNESTSTPTSTTKRTKILSEKDEFYNNMREELLEDDVDDEESDRREEDDDEDEPDSLEEAFRRLMESVDNEEGNCDVDDININDDDDDDDDEDDERKIKESFEEEWGPEKSAVNDVIHDLQKAMKRIESFIENTHTSPSHNELNYIRTKIANLVSRLQYYPNNHKSTSPMPDDDLHIDNDSFSRDSDIGTNLSF